MHIMIIGGAGMVGRKLAMRLATTGTLGTTDVGRLTLVDVVEAELPGSRPWEASLVADLSKPGEAERLISARPDVIFHLAAIVSGEAEADFDKGYRINLDGTRFLFEAIRQDGLREAL